MSKKEWLNKNGFELKYNKDLGSCFYEYKGNSISLSALDNMNQNILQAKKDLIDGVIDNFEFNKIVENNQPLIGEILISQKTYDLLKKNIEENTITNDGGSIIGSTRFNNGDSVILIENYDNEKNKFFLTAKFFINSNEIEVGSTDLDTVFCITDKDDTITHQLFLRTDDKREIFINDFNDSLFTYYRHFKGGWYTVIAVATDVDNLKKKIIYKSLNDNKIWVRDYDEFLSEVDHVKYPNCKEKYRFTSFNELCDNLGYDKAMELYLKEVQKC